MAEPVRSLMERYHLTVEDCSKQVSDRNLEELSRTHCSKWRRLPAHLNMDPIVEEDIDRKASAEDEKRHKFFKAWKQRNGSDATYKTLIAALLKIGCKKDAEYVCELAASELKMVPSAPAPEKGTVTMTELTETTAFADKNLSSTPEASHGLESAECDLAQNLQKLNIGEEKQVSIHDLDPDTRQELIMQLESNRDEIQAKYAAFVESLYKAIEAKNLTLKLFQLYLLSISAYESRHDGEQPLLLNDVKAQIKAAESIIDIFQILAADCCSFLNVGIFESIIKHYKINTSSHDLQYSQHLKEYLKSHRISEFIAINPKLKEVNDKEKMILKFDIALPNYITKVFDLQRAIAKILRVKPCTLHLVSIEEGCVIVTFSLPIAVAKCLFASGLTSTQEADIRDQSVLWLKCGSYALDPVSPSSEITLTTPPTVLSRQTSKQTESHAKEVPTLRVSKEEVNLALTKIKGDRDLIAIDLIGSTTGITSSITPKLSNGGVTMVVAGKSGSGKSALISNIFKMEENFHLSVTQTSRGMEVSQHGITIRIMNNSGFENDLKNQLKTVLKHTQKNADLLVYCMPVLPWSTFVQDPAIMQSLQDVYGVDIWKHCVIAITFGNIAFDYCKSKNPDQAVIIYKELIIDCAAKFKAQLKRLGVQDIDVKSIFEASEVREGTIIAIPVGYEIRDPVLPGIVRRGDEEGWKGRVFLEMLKKCRDNHKADLLQYHYGRELVQQILKKQGGVYIGTTGEAGTVVGKELGRDIEVARKNPKVLLGGLIEEAAGIVAGAIFGGATAVVKKLKTKELLPSNESSDTTEENETTASQQHEQRAPEIVAESFKIL